MIIGQRLGQGAGRRRRQGDPRRRPRPQSDRRRPDPAHSDPAAHRGAPQGAGQARRQVRRAAARRRAQRPPRRHGRPEEGSRRTHVISQDEHKKHGRRGAEDHRRAHQADRRRLASTRNRRSCRSERRVPTRDQRSMADCPSYRRPRSERRRPRHVAIIMDGNGRWAKQRGAAAHARPPRGRRGAAPHRRGAPASSASTV